MVVVLNPPGTKSPYITFSDHRFTLLDESHRPRIQQMCQGAPMVTVSRVGFGVVLKGKGVGLHDAGSLNYLFGRGSNNANVWYV